MTEVTELTFISLQLIFGHGICAAIKVFLQSVNLPAQDISEGLHLRQLLSQAVTLLYRQYSSANIKRKCVWLKPLKNLNLFNRLLRHSKQFQESSP